MYVGLTYTIALAWLVFTNPVQADDTFRLEWNPNTEMDLAGYKIYQSTTSGQYGDPIAVVGKHVTGVMGTIKTDIDRKYYFTVTAFDKSGNESAKAKEVSKMIAGTKVQQEYVHREPLPPDRSQNEPPF